MPVNLNFVSNGKVELLSSPQRCYTDVAAKITRSEKDIFSIVAEKENESLVRKIIESGHMAATEFNLYIFAVSGYSRVCEVQLVRKRMASYMIKSGRVDKSGKRSFDIVVPSNVMDVVFSKNGKEYDTADMLEMIDLWYESGVSNGFPEEDLRYMKPQGTEFQGLVAMNAHALMDWFKIRCCMNAQKEIRDMANKMLKLCKQDNEAMFKTAGASCVALGYCPENDMQNKACNVIKHREVLELIKNRR